MHLQTQNIYCIFIHLYNRITIFMFIFVNLNTIYQHEVSSDLLL